MQSQLLVVYDVVAPANWFFWVKTHSVVQCLHYRQFKERRVLAETLSSRIGNLLNHPARAQELQQLVTQKRFPRTILQTHLFYGAP